MCGVWCVVCGSIAPRTAHHSLLTAHYPPITAHCPPLIPITTHAPTDCRLHIKFRSGDEESAAGSCGIDGSWTRAGVSAATFCRRDRFSGGRELARWALLWRELARWALLWRELARWALLWRELARRPTLLWRELASWWVLARGVLARGILARGVLAWGVLARGVLARGVLAWWVSRLTTTERAGRLERSLGTLVGRVASHRRKLTRGWIPSLQRSLQRELAHLRRVPHLLLHRLVCWQGRWWRLRHGLHPKDLMDPIRVHLCCLRVQVPYAGSHGGGRDLGVELMQFDGLRKGDETDGRVGWQRTDKERYGLSKAAIGRGRMWGSRSREQGAGSRERGAGSGERRERRERGAGSREQAGDRGQDSGVGMALGLGLGLGLAWDRAAPGKLIRRQGAVRDYEHS